MSIAHFRVVRILGEHVLKAGPHYLLIIYPITSSWQPSPEPAFGVSEMNLSVSESLGTRRGMEGAFEYPIPGFCPKVISGLLLP